jgi:hypothetical protein
MTHEMLHDLYVIILILVISFGLPAIGMVCERNNEHTTEEELDQIHQEDLCPK